MLSYTFASPEYDSLVRRFKETRQKLHEDFTRAVEDITKGAQLPPSVLQTVHVFVANDHIIQVIR